MRKLKITVPITHESVTMHWLEVPPDGPYISRIIDDSKVYARLSETKTEFSRMTATKDGKTWFVEESLPPDTMCLTISVPEGNAGEMMCRVSKATTGLYTVDWGDGIINNERMHRYTKAGTYEVFITGVINLDRGDDDLANPSGVILKNIMFGGIVLTGIVLSTSADRTFRVHNCEIKSLNDIKPTNFHPNIDNFDHAFFGCTELREIPQDIFYNCRGVKSFRYTFFDNHKLKTVPPFLFLESTAVEVFESTFGYCSELENIHALMFDRNTKVTRFKLVFGKCVKLKNIPERLLFKMKAMTDVTGAFAHTAMESIPPKLLKYNIKLRSVSRLFGNTKISMVPPGLFETNIYIEDFSNTFDTCSNLTVFPYDLFIRNNRANIFNSTFYDCQKLTCEVPELWKKNIPLLVGERCFTGCINIVNYKDIPYVWRADNDYEGGEDGANFN